MKKLLFLIVAILATSFSARSEELTGRGLTLRNNIQVFLRNQGYAPSIDDYGAIKFKCEGITYYVAFQSFGNEYYVETYSMLGIDDTVRLQVFEAANKTVKDTKFVRIEVFDSSVSFGCVSLVNTVADYERIFDDFMMILKKSREKMKNFYAE
ncbi:MAG: hypothetical protein K2F64_05380 [Muribaculaceae bacterium]|nr:hypothetical protein [Muribaculaceae bacterium]